MFHFANITDLQLNGLPQPNVSNNHFVTTLLSNVIMILGALCLLMIVIGGFRYILSQGDPQGVSKSKATIVYALIGLVVVIVAQLIVSLVVSRIT